MPQYRALSLDLWFTTIYFEADDEVAWRAARIAALEPRLRDARGEPFRAEKIAAAVDRQRREFRRQGRETDVIHPRELVGEVIRRLGATVVGGIDAAATAYAAAGLDSHPPRLAEGVTRLGRALARRGVPVIAISNTARTELAWQSMFARLGGPVFRHIVTSCEVGRSKPDAEIFRRAAERLGLEPSEVLHVGDRWELDVAGAQAGGMAPAIYRGLWPRYPAAGYGAGSLPPNEGPGEDGDASVPRIDRWDELLDDRRFAFAPR